MRKFLFESFNSIENDLYLIYEQNAIPEKKHIHNFVELVYVASGCIEHIIDGEKFTCFRGDFLLIDTDSVHSFNIKDNAAYFNLCIKIENNEIINDSILIKNKDNLKNRIISFVGDERRELENVLRSMYIEECSKMFENNSVFDSYFTILSVKIARKLYQSDEDNYDNWNKVIEYIDNNLDEQLSLRSVANKCFYNSSYFSRLFKAKIGKTFIAYVNERKIEKAKELLINTSNTVEEIYKTLGFSSIQTFYKTFTIYEKIPPIQFREKYKNKKTC